MCVCERERERVCVFGIVGSFFLDQEQLCT